MPNNNRNLLYHQRRSFSSLDPSMIFSSSFRFIDPSSHHPHLDGPLKNSHTHRSYSYYHQLNGTDGYMSVEKIPSFRKAFSSWKDLASTSADSSLPSDDSLLSSMRFCSFYAEVLIFLFKFITKKNLLELI